MKIIENFDKLLKSNDIVGELRKISKEKLNDFYDKLHSDIIFLCHDAAMLGRNSVFVRYEVLRYLPRDEEESALHSRLESMGFRIDHRLDNGFVVSWEKV